MTDIVLITIVLAFGGLAFSFTGFGFALVTLPLMAFLLPLKVAVGFLFPYTLTLVIYHAWHFGRKLEFRIVWPLILGSVLTMPLGLLFLQQIPESWLKKCLAIFVVLALLLIRLRGVKTKKIITPGTKFIGFLCGLISGWFQGAYTTGGPPAVVYVSYFSSEPEEAKGYMGTYFAFICCFTLVMYAASGVFTARLLMNSLAFSPAVIFGTWIGAVLSRRVDIKTYRMGVDLLLILAAAMLWFQS
jgi:uncharacterized protein